LRKSISAAKENRDQIGHGLFLHAALQNNLTCKLQALQ